MSATASSPRWGRRAATPRQAHPGHRCLCAQVWGKPACSSRSRRRCGNTRCRRCAPAHVVYPDRADGRSCTARGRVRAAPVARPQPASATTGRHQKWLGRGGISPRPISSVEGVPRGESRVTVLHMLSMSSRADTSGRILRAAASCRRLRRGPGDTCRDRPARPGVKPDRMPSLADTRSIMASMLTSPYRRRAAGGAPRRGRPGSVVKQIVAVADRLRGDDLIMSVMHSGWPGCTSPAAPASRS